MGLSVDDWVNLGISLLLVVLALTVVPWVLLFALKHLVRRTPNSYDDRYVRSVRPYLRWLIGLIALNAATTHLEFLGAEPRRILSHVYFALMVTVVAIALWKLVDIYVLWYREKAAEQGERVDKEAVLLLVERAVRAPADPGRLDRCVGSGWA